MEGLFGAINIQDEEVRNTALEAISEVPMVSYHHCAEYIPKIGEISMLVLQAAHQVGIKHMIAFWHNICKKELVMREEKTQFSGIIEANFDPISEIIKQAICMHEFDLEDDSLCDTVDDEEWSVQLACAWLLKDVSELVKEKSWGKFFEWAGQKMTSENWIERYTGLITLQGIISEANAPMVVQQLSGNMQWFFDLAASENQRLRFVTSCVFLEFARVCPHLLVGDHERAQIFYQATTTAVTHDHPQIKSQYAAMWAGIFTFYKGKLHTQPLLF